MTRITNNEIEKFRLNFSNRLTHDRAPLKVKFCTKEKFNVLPSCKQVCRLSLKKRLAVALEKTCYIIVSKILQVEFTQNNFLTNKTPKGDSMGCLGLGA